MKYVVVLGDGMADEPLEALGGCTPIEAAQTPVMDELASKGELGLATMIPEGMKPGSDTANLAVLGYYPRKYYSGRSPLEALSIGVDMKDDDIAIRTNIVTLSDDDVPFEKKTIIDHSSGEISTEDCAVLLDAVRAELENDEFRFYVGTSYRHCLIWAKGKVLDFAQPHDHLGQVIGEYLPKDERFLNMMKRSYEILNNHSLNIERAKKGLNKANCLWFWGAGTKPMVSSFEEKTGKRGAMISAVDLLKGIAKGASMKVIEVPGATGSLETNYEGKAQAAVDVLLKENYDFVYIHVEAPDEMGHQGSIDKKIKAVSYLDSRIVKPVRDALAASGEPFRMMILPDHPTPIWCRTHTSDPVPYIIYDSEREAKCIRHYSEKEAARTGIFEHDGYKLIDRLFQ